MLFYFSSYVPIKKAKKAKYNRKYGKSEIAALSEFLSFKSFVLA